MTKVDTSKLINRVRVERFIREYAYDREDDRIGYDIYPYVEEITKKFIRKWSETAVKLTRKSKRVTAKKEDYEDALRILNIDKFL